MNPTVQVVMVAGRNEIENRNNVGKKTRRISSRSPGGVFQFGFRFRRAECTTGEPFAPKLRTWRHIRVSIFIPYRLNHDDNDPKLSDPWTWMGKIGEK
jgi:hypothetical protein